MSACHRCADRGAVKVEYESGEPFDLGICWCAVGERLRETLSKAPGLVSRFFGVPDDRIAFLEVLAEPQDWQAWGEVAPGAAIASDIDDDIAVSAGRLKRAKL